jgi:hypothetical protein
LFIVANVARASRARARFAASVDFLIFYQVDRQPLSTLFYFRNPTGIRWGFGEANPADALPAFEHRIVTNAD